MHQYRLLALTNADCVTIGQGGIVPCRIGAETVALIHAKWLDGASPTPPRLPLPVAHKKIKARFGAIPKGRRTDTKAPFKTEGEPPTQRVTVQPARRKRRDTVKRYTMTKKRKVLADLAKAPERGETVKDVLRRHGISEQSGSPYMWRKQFAAEKNRG
jgi:hypothetical protein